MTQIKKTGTGGKVVMVDDAPCTRQYKQHIESFIRFGKEVKVTPKAHAAINKPGYTSEYFVPTVSVIIGIGNEHTADLVMSLDAWNALQKGAQVQIMTTEEYKKKYVYPVSRDKNNKKKKK